MSNDLMVPEAAGLPAYAVNKDLASALWGDMISGMPVGQPPRLKMNGAKFAIVDANGVETPIPMGSKAMVTAADENVYLQMLVLAGRKELQKSYYIEKYNPNDEVHAAPDCFSNNSVNPDPSAPSPQADSCALCPHNAFGSGTDQNGNATKGKACGDQKILAVAIPNFMAKEASDPPLLTFSFKIPPASFKNWGLLGKKLRDASIVPSMVKYLVGFDADASFPLLVFKYGGVVGENAVPVLAAMAESQEVKDILNNNITSNGGNAEKTPAQAAKKTEVVAPTDPAMADALANLGQPAPEKKARASRAASKPAAPVAPAQDDFGMGGGNTAEVAGSPSTDALRDALGL